MARKPRKPRPKKSKSTALVLYGNRPVAHEASQERRLERVIDALEKQTKTKKRRKNTMPRRKPTAIQVVQAAPVKRKRRGGFGGGASTASLSKALRRVQSLENREKRSKERLFEVTRSGLSSTAAFGAGYVQGRYDGALIAGTVPGTLVVGLGLHLAGFFMRSKWSRHLHAVGQGVTDAYLATTGTAYGKAASLVERGKAAVERGQADLESLTSE